MRPTKQDFARRPDERGMHTKFFMKSKQGEVLNQETREVFMTTNKKNVIRGMHFQRYHAGAKVLSCLAGSAYVQVVSIDPAADDYKAIYKFLVQNDNQVLVPIGYALGYRALADNTQMLYITDQEHYAEYDVGLSPFSFDWTLNPRDLFIPIASQRDKELISSDDFFKFMDEHDNTEDYLRGGLK